MLRELREQGLVEGRHRATLELSLSSNPSIYAVEDDSFLYYAQNVKESQRTVQVFHIVKGRFDYSMEISDWETFAKMMLEVNDEFFVSGEGKDFKECFLGNYLSKYSRRKAFINELMCVIDDARGWLDVE